MRPALLPPAACPPLDRRVAARLPRSHPRAVTTGPRYRLRSAALDRVRRTRRSAVPTALRPRTRAAPAGRGRPDRAAGCRDETRRECRPGRGRAPARQDRSAARATAPPSGRTAHRARPLASGGGQSQPPRGLRRGPRRESRSRPELPDSAAPWRTDSPATWPARTKARLRGPRPLPPSLKLRRTGRRGLAEARLLDRERRRMLKC